MMDAPSEMESVGALAAPTDIGGAEVSYVAAKATFAFEQDELPAIRRAIVSKLDHPSGVPKLKVREGVPSRRLPRVSGVLLVDLNLKPNLALLAGPDPNAIAIRIVDQALAVIKRYLQVCIGVTESEDITLDRTGLGKWAGITFVNNEGDIVDHNYFWMTPPADRRMSPAVVKSRYPHSVNSLRDGHPIDQVVQWKVLAKRQINLEHDYQSAAISTNTSIEILTWALLRALEQDLIRAGDALKSAKVTNIAQGTNFVAAIQKVGSLLDTASWQVPGSQNPVGQPAELADYWTASYMLRNNVVHNGYAPVLTEAEQSYRLAEKLWERLRDLVGDRASDFPGTALMLLGKQELHWRGLLTDIVNDAIDAAANAHPDGTWNPPKV